ncbi:synaptotagmin-4 isoform X2 [Arachis duranensis]|uniref:Synaptotagmin-4 isoform X2 n=1 Tax=Arachis duranensis TaxID=130453 RepID=A0A9C6TQW9_ARADU|nr:synaptotagmin-4 isoform X2 [Arachis duranensis]
MSSSGKRKLIPMNIEEAALLLSHVTQPRIPFLLALLFLIAYWVSCFSNLLLLALALWTTIQYQSYQRKLLEEDLNKKWRRIMLNSSPVTPLEHCEWLNKFLTQVWPNYFNPKLSRRLSAIVEKRLKLRKPSLIEKVDLREFSLGSCPPSLGLQGVRWSTSGDQRILNMGFDWDTSDMSILMLAKLAKPLMGTTRIMINSLHIKGDLLITPILDGKALLYSFSSKPEVRIGIAFGSGGTEVPGVSSWLEKLFTDTLLKTMVEPRRRCFSLPAVNLRKRVVGGIIYVTVISANKLSRSCFKGSPSLRQQNGCLEEKLDDKDLQTFVEVEAEELTRRTGVSRGSTPTWDATFNMVLHDSTGIVRFNLYECLPSSVKYDYLASCEIKMRHVEDDSTIMWATGPNSGVIATHTKDCGDEIEMTVPFEGASSGELKVRIVVKEWQFADGSHSLNSLSTSSQPPLSESSNLQSKTGRKLRITVVEAKDLATKDKFGKVDTYVKLQYEKDTASSSQKGWIELVVIEARDLIAADLRGTSDPYVRVDYGNLKKRTKVIPKTLNPQWNQTLDFLDDGSLLVLRVKDHNALLPTSSIGECVVEYQRLPPNQMVDKWIPLQGVKSGEIHIQITRNVPEMKMRQVVDSEPSLSTLHQIPTQMKEMMMKFRSLIDDGNVEGLSRILSELETLEDTQEGYIAQLETQQMMLLSKIKELGQQIINSSPSLQN